MSDAASGSELILHHYATSPFSEKVRLIFGYKGLAWRGVTVPSIMPKPDVVALTGGYRRTPFMQVGADIYCDTALICEELEHRAPQPSLYPVAVRGMARVLAQWADSTLFWTAMAYNLQPRGAAQLFAGAPPEAARAFAADRGAMRQGMARQHPGDATAAYRSYLRRLSTMLESHAFLLGDAPTVADFAAYHPLWFTRTRVPVLADVFDSTPSVLAWMDRMAAIGHGQHSGLSSADAIALAAACKPAPLADTTFQDEHGIALGEAVTITAESFGPEPTAGTLVAATRTRYVIARTDDRAGTVHVHFPRIGFSLKKADAP
jgi:glutathione S-transferase